MSFEGYYQVLCYNGHHFTADLHTHELNVKCPFCLCSIVWDNLVDTTNGENDGAVVLECTAIELSTCPRCNGKGQLNVPTYKIPKKGRVNED